MDIFLKLDIDMRLGLRWIKDLIMIMRRYDMLATKSYEKKKKKKKKKKTSQEFNEERWSPPSKYKATYHGFMDP